MTRRTLAIVGVASVIQLSSLAVTAAAQWIHYPTAGVPRARDGKPDLSPPAPRAPNGKPDFSGVWENDGYDPNGVEGLAGGPPKTAFFDIVNGRNPKYAEWLSKV